MNVDLRYFDSATYKAMPSIKTGLMYYLKQTASIDSSLVDTLYTTPNNNKKPLKKVVFHNLVEFQAP